MSKSKTTRRVAVGLATLTATVGFLSQLACSHSASPAATAADQSEPRVSGEPVRIDGVPADRLDLTNWKLTLPIGEQFSPTEVRQPELKSFVDKDYFFLSEQGVVFRADAGGVTTPNSAYPRTELREMAEGGAKRAAWSTTSGRHTIRYVAAITSTPPARPHVVAGQLLGPKDDVVMIRLERTHLYVEGGGNNLGTLEKNYELGTFFSIAIDASKGRVRVFYNDESTPRVDIQRAVDNCYFKIGSYIQSNLERGDRRDAHGEVVVSAMSVEHSD